MPKRTAIAIGAKPEKMPVAKRPATIEEECISLLQKVKTLRVTTPEECADAVALGSEVHRRLKQWKDHEWPVYQSARQTADLAYQKYKKIESPLKNAENYLKKLVGDFKLLQKRLADAAADARRRQLEEQTQQREHEYQEQLEDERKRAMAARDEEIQAAFDAGDDERARRLAAEPLQFEEPMPPPLDVAPGPVELGLAREEGLGSFGEGWDFKVVDLSQVPDRYKTWSVDTAKVRQDLRMMGGNLRIPGIEIFEKPKVTFK